MAKKSQSAFEFLILTGVVIFFFTIFFFVINESMSEKLRDKQTNSVKETAFKLQDEINMAHKSTEGYYREFILPADINGETYSILITEELIYLNTTDSKNALALPIPNVTGQPVKGNNIIKKQNDTIYLNT